MASLAIKISTQKAIETLENRIALAEAAVKEWDLLDKQHEAAMKKFRADQLKFVTKNGKPTAISRRWYGDGEVEVTFKLNEGVVLPAAPEAPKRDVTNLLNPSVLEDLKQTVRILKMTDEPTVNASIMKKFADYL